MRARELDPSLLAAPPIEKKWTADRPITIRFLEGDSYIQDKVKEMALDWTNYANMEFRFANDNQDADIQIAFRQGAGSWAYIGTDAKTVPHGEPTMNFGWLDANTPDREYSRVVKHEFGHALGLIHEHQNPAGGVKWNKDAIYEALSRRPYNWDRKTIDYNIFERYSKTITQYTQLDPVSIMTYWISPEWTVDHMSFGENLFGLSDTDKAFIRKQYP